MSRHKNTVEKNIYNHFDLSIELIEVLDFILRSMKSARRTWFEYLFREKPICLVGAETYEGTNTFPVLVLKFTDARLNDEFVEIEIVDLEGDQARISINFENPVIDYEGYRILREFLRKHRNQQVFQKDSAFTVLTREQDVFEALLRPIIFRPLGKAM